MASIKQYFDSDFKGFFWYEGPVDQIGDTRTGATLDPPVGYRILHHAKSRASCVAFFVPKHPPQTQAAICKAIIDLRDWWLNLRKGLRILTDGPLGDLSATVFTGRAAIYVDGYVSPSDVAQLQAYAKTKEVDLVIHDLTYAEARDAIERPHAFMSHDSRDKEKIALPLVTALSSGLCRVWYDEYSLAVGDSLRESIEGGLKICHRCILVLTPNFLGNQRWPKAEYDAIFTREIVEEKRLILPVWAGVTRDDVFQYSPVLADRVAALWDGDPEDVARKLLKVLL